MLALHMALRRLARWGSRARFFLYHLLSYPTKFHNIRFFRFGIPLVLKTSDRTNSTEADALRFLRAAAESYSLGRLPIPRLIDDCVFNGQSLTLMTRVPGVPLINVWQSLTETETRTVVSEVLAVVNALWTIPQPAENKGQVMLSASGHGILDPSYFYEWQSGPYPSLPHLYAALAGCGRYPEAVDTYVEQFDQETRDVLEADEIGWCHSDLRMYNVFVQDGHLSGIVDWEDSAWLPKMWALHVLRNVQIGCMGEWSRSWKATQFSEATEAAFVASYRVIRHRL